MQAVIDYQAGTITGNQRHAELGSPEGLRAWRDTVIAQVKTGEGKGGCPLGSLAGQVAETDAQARALIAAGFGQWSAAISDGLRRLHDTGHLLNGTDPDDLAVTLLAALQGGLLLAQVQRDTRPLETALDTLLELARISRQDAPTDRQIPRSKIPTGTCPRPRADTKAQSHLARRSRPVAVTIRSRSSGRRATGSSTKLHPRRGRPPGGCAQNFQPWRPRLPVRRSQAPRRYDARMSESLAQAFPARLAPVVAASCRRFPRPASVRPAQRPPATRAPGAAWSWR